MSTPASASSQLVPAGRPPANPPAAALRWSGRDGVAIVVLGLLVACFFWRILTPRLVDRASFPPGDFSHQFWAFATFEARELGLGRLPLWNPYTYSGAPFWADIQSAVLYPFSLLTLLVSAPWGFSLFALECEAILHFWLAALFTYLLARRLMQQRGAAFLTAITFAFGGYLTGYPSQQLAVLEADVWLPLLLYFSDRALVERHGQEARPRLRLGWPETLAAGLTFGCAILAGHPQSAMFVFYAFTLYVLFLPGLRAALTARAQHWVVSLGLGLGLSAVAWLPGLEYMRLSVRAIGTYDKMAGGFPFYDPVQLLLPGSVSHYSPLYVGILPLLLAIWAAVRIRQRPVIFWACIAAGALLLSFGGETFLYSLFYLGVPGFATFRDQERVAFIFSLAMAILAGYGFRDALAAGQGVASNTCARNEPAFSKLAGWMLVGALGLVIAFFYGLNYVGWKDDSPFNMLLGRSVWLVLLLAMSWGLARAAQRRTATDQATGASTWVTLGCLLLVGLDLFTANWKTNLHDGPPEEQTAVPSVVQAIQQDATPGEVFRVYNEYRIYENYGVPYALEDTWGASPLRLERYDQLYHTLRMERVWQLLNVKYVITWRQELYAPSDIIFQEPAGKDTTYVHRLRSVAPRAWLVYRLETLPEDQQLSRLDAPDFDPARQALVSGELAHASLSPPPAEQVGSVQFEQRTPGYLSLAVQTPKDGLLVLSEVFYPGWQARLDGQPATIELVNYTLRGVLIPAGEHRLELIYWPASWVWGSAISGASLVACLAVGGGAWLRRRRRTAYTAL